MSVTSNRNGSVGSPYIVIQNIDKCSKEVGHFQGLSQTHQIPGLSRPKEHNFKIQGLYSTCTKPRKSSRKQSGSMMQWNMITAVVV